MIFHVKLVDGTSFDGERKFVDLFREWWLFTRFKIVASVDNVFIKGDVVTLRPQSIMWYKKIR